MQRNANDLDSVLTYFVESLDEQILKDLYVKAPAAVRAILDADEMLTILALRTNRKESSFLDFLSPKKVKGTTSKSCTLENSSDVCVRRASAENEADLVQLFIEEGATDVFGALVNAAENGADEAVNALAPFCSVKMFDSAAAHAALGGHRDLMIELYSSGMQSQITKNSILQMAIRGGQYECAEYIMQRRAVITAFEMNLLGKNLKQMVRLFRNFRLQLNPCSIASFGGPEDYQFALKRDPTLFDADPFLYLICALENNNEYFISILTPMIGESADYQRLYQAACVGGNDRMILKYARKASKLLEGMYTVVAAGKLDLLKKLLAIKKLSMKNAPVYAGYSGSSAMVSFVVTKEADIALTRLLAIGAAAGGNYDQLRNYALALEDYAEYTRYFAEALAFSRYNLFERLYSDCKDQFPAEKVRYFIENALETPSVLKALPQGPTHPMLLERVREILG